MNDQLDLKVKPKLQKLNIKLNLDIQSQRPAF